MAMHECDEFQNQLTASLLDDVAVPASALAAANACTSCAPILRDLAQVVDPEHALEPSPQVASRAIARGRRWARGAHAVGKLINITVSLVLVSIWLVYVELGYRAALGVRLPSLGEQVRALVVISTVLVIGYLALRGWGPRDHRRILYARWPRRQVQGVCVGIAEFFRVPVWLIRMVVLVLFFAGLGGGTIYFLLAFLVDWHPDDRQYMTWFRIQRWWRRRRA